MCGIHIYFSKDDAEDAAYCDVTSSSAHWGHVGVQTVDIMMQSCNPVGLHIIIAHLNIISQNCHLRIIISHMSDL